MCSLATHCTEPSNQSVVQSGFSECLESFVCAYWVEQPNLTWGHGDLILFLQCKISWQCSTLNYPMTGLAANVSQVVTRVLMQWTCIVPCSFAYKWPFFSIQTNSEAPWIWITEIQLYKRTGEKARVPDKEKVVKGEENAVSCHRKYSRTSFICHETGGAKTEKHAILKMYNPVSLKQVISIHRSGGLREIQA